MFGDEETRQFWETGRSRKTPPASLRKVAKRKLAMVNAAARLDDLKIPPGNRLHPLKRDPLTNMQSGSTTSFACVSLGKTVMPTTSRSRIITTNRGG